MATLRELFDANEAARQWLEHLGLMNSVGRTPEERIQMDIDYEKARAKYLATHDAYHNAIRKEVV